MSDKMYLSTTPFVNRLHRKRFEIFKFGYIQQRCPNASFHIIWWWISPISSPMLQAVSVILLKWDGRSVRSPKRHVLLEYRFSYSNNSTPGKTVSILRWNTLRIQQVSVSCFSGKCLYHGNHIAADVRSNKACLGRSIGSSSQSLMACGGRLASRYSIG